MGQKVNPRAFRNVTTYKTPSRWFASKNQFASTLQSDIEIRKFLRKEFRDGGVDRIEFERSAGAITIIIFTSKPGVIIGRGGVKIDEIKQTVKRTFFGSQKIQLNVSIQEVRQPDLSAELVYQNIRDQIEARVPFRRAIKRGMENIMRAGALGARIQIAGRLNGADIARTETLSQGRLPLHTLRAKIDYTRGIAQTIYGVIGIKVWIYSGDSFGEEEEAPQATVAKKKRTDQPRRRQRSRIQTGGEKLVLRKKSDVKVPAGPSA